MPSLDPAPTPPPAPRPPAVEPRAARSAIPCSAERRARAVLVAALAALGPSACGGRVELGVLAEAQPDGGPSPEATGGGAPSTPPDPEAPADCGFAGTSTSPELLLEDARPSGREVRVVDFAGDGSALFTGLARIAGASLGRVVALPEAFVPFDVDLGPENVAGLGLLAGDRLVIHVPGYARDVARVVSRASGAPVREIALNARRWGSHPTRPHVFVLDEAGVSRHDVDTGATTVELAAGALDGSWGLTSVAVGPNTVVAEAQYLLDDRYEPPTLFAAVPGASPRRLATTRGLVSNVAVGAEVAYVVTREGDAGGAAPLALREIALTGGDATTAGRVVATLPAAGTNAHVELDARHVYVASTDASAAGPCLTGGVCPSTIVVSRVDRAAGAATELLRFEGPSVGQSSLVAFRTTSCHVAWSDGYRLQRRAKASFP